MAEAHVGGVTMIASMLALSVAFALPGGGQDSAESSTLAANDVLARLESALLHRPDVGHVFDRWYQEATADSTEQGVWERVQEAAEAESRDANRWLVAGLVASRQERTSEALDAYQRAESLDPDASTAPRLAARVLSSEGRWDETRRVLRRAIERCEETETQRRLRIDLARAQQRAGASDQAQETLKALAREADDDIDLLGTVADALSDDAPREALAVWETIESLTRDDVEGQHRAGLARSDLLVQLGDEPAARAVFADLWHRLDPESWHARDVRERARASFEAVGDSLGWRRFLEHRLARAPGDVDARAALIDALSEAGDLDQATEHHRTLLARRPGRLDLHLVHVRRLAHARRPEDAQETTRTLLPEHPHDPALWTAHVALAHWVTTSIEPIAEPIALREVLSRALDVNGQSDDWVRWAVETATAVARDAPAVARTGLPKPPTAFHGQTPRPPLLNDSTRHALRTLIPWLRELCRQTAPGSGSRRPLAAALDDVGRPDLARSMNWDSVSGPDTSADDLVQLAVAFAHRRHFTDAQDALERALRTSPGHEEALELATTISVHRLRPDEALDRLRTLDEGASTSRRREELLLRQIEIAERFDRLLSLKESAQSLDDSRSLHLAALLAEQERDPGHASTLLRRLWQRSPDDAYIGLRLVDTLTAARRQREAVMIAEELAESIPGDAMEFHRRRVMLLLELEQFEDAKTVSEGLLDASPNDVSVRRLHADVLQRVGDPEEVIAAWREAVELAPQDTASRLSLAHQLHAVGRSKEAFEHVWMAYESAATEAQSEAVVPLLRATAHRGLRLDDLVKRLERLIRADRRPSPAIALLCTVLDEDGRLDELTSLRRRLVGRFPRDTSLRSALVETLQRQQRWDEALDHHQRLDPSTPGHTALHAELLTWVGQHEESQATWQTHWETRPEEPSVTAALEQVAKSTVHAADFAIGAFRAGYRHVGITRLACSLNWAAGRPRETLEALRHGTLPPASSSDNLVEVQTRQPWLPEPFLPATTLRRTLEIHREATQAGLGVSRAFSPFLDPARISRTRTSVFRGGRRVDAGPYEWPALPETARAQVLNDAAHSVRALTQRSSVELPAWIWQEFDRDHFACLAAAAMTALQNDDPDGVASSQEELAPRLPTELPAALWAFELAGAPDHVIAHVGELQRFRTFANGVQRDPADIPLRCERAIKAVRALAERYPSGRPFLLVVLAARLGRFGEVARMAPLWEQSPLDLATRLCLWPWVATVDDHDIRRQFERALLLQANREPDLQHGETSLLLGLLHHGTEEAIRGARPRFDAWLAQSPDDSLLGTEAIYVQRGDIAYDLYEPARSPQDAASPAHQYVRECLAQRLGLATESGAAPQR